MAVVIWPSNLPQTVNRNNHRQQLGDGRLHSPTTEGVGKTRLLTSANNRPCYGEMPLDTLSLKLRFERFWDDDTAGGTLPFLFPAIGINRFPLLTMSGTPLVRRDGSPIRVRKWWLVMFSPNEPAPVCVPKGAGWLAPIAWEVLP